MASLTYKLYHTPSTSPLSDRASHFFTQFGHSLTSLTLQAYAFSNSKDYFSIVSHLVGRDCPSLTRLALTHLQHLDYKDPLDPAILNFTSPSIRHFTLSFGSNFFPGPRSVSNCAAVFSSLLAIVPNATSLTTSCPGGGETFLRTLRDYNISAHLTSFSLTSAPLDMGAMNVLNSMNFGKLTSLKINTQFTVQPEFIHFLEKLSPTLEKLVIHGDKWGVMATYGNGFTMDFPLMPELRVFQHESYECLRVAGDDFLQRLPNLGELVIRDFLSSLVDMRRTVYGTMFSPRGEMRPNYANVHVKKVVLGVVFVPSDENLGVMETLLKMFPNVAELEVAVSFAYQNVHVGQVLDTLAKSKIKKLKITFLQCSELISERVAASFRSVLGNYLPKFSELQRVEFILDDMPPMARFNLPLGIVKGILCTKSLSVLNLTGFSLGENLEETEMCRQLVDEKLVQWKLSEGVITRSLISLASNFSNFEYKLVDY
ncbi:uncharacterized protein LOC118439340 [Folsomia candida]|uniref:uncharacterized protein LOC118439340 n=1 Tax=Folsomia candida TaxID=158441 RepID=UPI001604B929|nr:uncharacterized protein LOC118439340 [Folsomia candida]